MIVTPISTFPADGMQTASARFNAQADAIAKGNIEPETQVALIESERAFEANAASAKVADETLGTLIDAHA